MFAKTKQQITSKCKVKLINNQTHPVSFQCTQGRRCCSLTWSGLNTPKKLSAS